MGKSTKSSSASQANQKPEKPYPDFPLFAHDNGLWAKKIRRRLHYFGPWRDDRQGQAAEAKYSEQREDLHAGRRPRTPQDGLTVRKLVNRFLNEKRHQAD